MLRSTFKVLVCGGRYYADKARLFALLDEMHSDRPITLLAQGGAGGADSLAREWALDRVVPCATFDAPWTKRGRSAGPIRNAWMLSIVAPDLVVAFPGGAGTEDMVRRAHRAAVRVRRVSPPTEEPRS